MVNCHGVCHSPLQTLSSNLLDTTIWVDFNVAVYLFLQSLVQAVSNSCICVSHMCFICYTGLLLGVCLSVRVDPMHKLLGTTGLPVTLMCAAALSLHRYKPRQQPVSLSSPGQSCLNVIVRGVPDLCDCCWHQGLIHSARSRVTSV